MRIIKITEDHFVLTDDSTIREGDWFVHNYNPIHYTVHFCDGDVDSYRCKKITHSTEPLDVKITEDGIHLPDWTKVKPLSPREVKGLIQNSSEQTHWQVNYVSGKLKLV